MKKGIPTLHELYDEVLTILLGKPGQPEELMDQHLRRELGAHYTDEENILKLLNPLFLDDLWKEFNKVKTTPAAIDKFHDKIASLKFLDPACGCGNFLMLTYRELCLLELEVLKMKVSRDDARLVQLLREGVDENDIILNGIDDLLMLRDLLVDRFGAGKKAS